MAEENTVSYHQCLQVLDLNCSMVTRRTIRPKVKKTRDGCFNCKRRKKKCDEEKPACKACVRNSLECSWPGHVINKVTHKSKMEEFIDCGDSNEGTNFVDTATGSNPNISDGRLFSYLDQDMETFVKTLDTELQNSMAVFDSTFDIHDDFVLDQFLNMQAQKDSLMDNHSGSDKSLSPIRDTTYDKADLFIPGVQLSDVDLACYDAFVNIVIPSISYSHHHSVISPFTLILPFVKTNHIVRETAFACGASVLTYQKDSFRSEVVNRYNKVVGLLIKEIKDPKSSCGDHVFVCAQLLQTLCLRDKNVGFNITLCAAHFSSSYGIIKKKFLQKSLPIVFNTNLKYRTTPLDRLLTDQFILHFPLNIMLCHFTKLTDSSVPSPFKFYERFNHILDMPIQGIPNCEDPWLNHPITGVGLKAQIISAKCAWICRFLKVPVSEDDLVTYFCLLVEATNELRRLNDILEFNTELTNSQKSNVHLAKTVIYADLIILKKVCYYERTTVESLKDLVDMMIGEEKLGRSLQPEGYISVVWSLFIGASSSSTSEQKEFYSKALKYMADQIHSTICLKILKYLNVIWSEGLDDDFETSADKTHSGFEFLFDTIVLAIVEG